MGAKDRYGAQMREISPDWGTIARIDRLAWVRG